MKLKKWTGIFFGIALTAVIGTQNIFAMAGRPNPNPDAPPPPAWVQFGPILFMVVIFYFLLIRPQLRQRKEHQKMVGDLKKGDKVVLQGGFIVTIVNILPHTLEVKINEETRAKILRTAVTELYIEPTETKDISTTGGTN
jgi:preprotein translocase subunit YajC